MLCPLKFLHMEMGEINLAASKTIDAEERLLLTPTRHHFDCHNG